MKRLILLTVIFLAACSCSTKQISLAGDWSVTLGDDSYSVFEVHLPGTLEEAGIGEAYVPDKYREITLRSCCGSKMGPWFK